MIVLAYSLDKYKITIWLSIIYPVMCCSEVPTGYLLVHRLLLVCPEYKRVSL